MKAHGRECVDAPGKRAAASPGYGSRLQDRRGVLLSNSLSRHRITEGSMNLPADRSEGRRRLLRS